MNQEEEDFFMGMMVLLTFKIKGMKEEEHL